MNKPAATAIYRAFGSNKMEASGPLSAADCKILNKVTAKLVKLGAASQERLAKTCRLELHSVRWALWNLDAVHCKGLDLYTLPE